MDEITRQTICTDEDANGWQFTHNFKNNAINLSGMKRKKLRIDNLSFKNSFHVISANLGNNKWRMYSNSLCADVEWTITDGVYTLNAFNTWLISRQIAEGAATDSVPDCQLSANAALMRVSLSLVTNTTVDFTQDDTPHTLLGFGNIIVTTENNIGTSCPQFGGGRVHLHCDLCRSGGVIDQKNNASPTGSLLKSFSITASPSEMVRRTYEQDRLMFNINVDRIQYIRFWCTFNDLYTSPRQELNASTYSNNEFNFELCYTILGV